MLTLATVTRNSSPTPRATNPSLTNHCLFHLAMNEAIVTECLHSMNQRSGVYRKICSTKRTLSNEEKKSEAPNLQSL